MDTSDRTDSQASKKRKLDEISAPLPDADVPIMDAVPELTDDARAAIIKGIRRVCPGASLSIILTASSYDCRVSEVKDVACLALERMLVDVLKLTVFDLRFSLESKSIHFSFLTHETQQFMRSANQHSFIAVSGTNTGGGVSDCVFWDEALFDVENAKASMFLTSTVERSDSKSPTEDKLMLTRMVTLLQTMQSGKSTDCCSFDWDRSKNMYTVTLHGLCDTIYIPSVRQLHETFPSHCADPVITFSDAHQLSVSMRAYLYPFTKTWVRKKLRV